MAEYKSSQSTGHYGYSIDRRENVIHLSISNESIIKYYIEECNKWYISSQFEPPPHPFSMLDKVIRDLSLLVGGSMRLNRFSKCFRSGPNYYPINGMEVFGSFQNGTMCSCFGYQVDSKDTGELKFETTGDFFKPMIPSWGKPVLEYKFVEMRTKDKHEISFSNFGVTTNNPSLLTEITDLIMICPCNPRYFILNYGGHPSYLQYICPVCGKRYYCDCFLPLKNLWASMKRMRPKFPETDRKTVYRQEICHVCRDVIPPPVFVHKMYGSFFMQRYSPWVYKDLYIMNNLRGNFRRDSQDVRKAENLMRKKLGVYQIGEKWVSETAMYYLIRTICGDRYEVIHHARPKFLNGMEYDVFIPVLMLAFEYDGIQHERAVSYFGGEEALNKTKERDKAKDEISKELNIRLVRIKDSVSVEKLDSIILEQEKNNG